MPKYQNALTGRVVERTATYVAAYPADRFVPVTDTTDVYVEPCCGATDSVDEFEAALAFEDKE